MKEYIDEVPDWSETPLKKNKRIKVLLEARQDAAATISQAEKVKGEASVELLTILTSAGVEKARVNNFTISVVTVERVSLQEGQLKKMLLEGGMSLARIEKLWKECSTSAKSSYVKVSEKK